MCLLKGKEEASCDKYWKRREACHWILDCFGVEVRSFAIRKQAIDMRRIHTIGRDIMDSTFTGDTRSAYGILLRFQGLVCLRWA